MSLNWPCDLPPPTVPAMRVRAARLARRAAGIRRALSLHSARPCRTLSRDLAPTPQPCLVRFGGPHCQGQYPQSEMPRSMPNCRLAPILPSFDFYDTNSRVRGKNLRVRGKNSLVRGCNSASLLRVSASPVRQASPPAFWYRQKLAKLGGSLTGTRCVSVYP